MTDHLLPTSSRSTSASRYLELVRVLAERNLKGRYRGSVLGVFWSLSNPLIMTVVYTLIFGSAFKSYYGSSIVSYVLAVFLGLSLLQFFSQGSSQALGSIVAGGSLANKISLPLSVFPVSAVLANAIQFAVGILPILIIVVVAVSRRPMAPIELFVPLIALVLITMGFGLAMASLYVFFRDLSYMYEVVLFVLWMTSPIFYPAQIVPVSLLPYMRLNPIAAVVTATRQITFDGGLSPHTALVILGMGVGVFAVGAAIFVSTKRQFMDLL